MSARSARARAVLLELVGVAVVLVAWHLIATLFFTRSNGSYGAVPPPWAIATRALESLTEAGYQQGIAATAASAITGYGIALLIAFVLGVSVLLVPPLEAFSTQLGVIAACIPVAAISPIVAVLSPSGSRAVSVVLATLAVAFPMIIGVLLGLRSSSPAQLDLVRAYGGGPVAEIRRVRAIAAIPDVLSALKIGAPAAFLGAMTGEFFAVGVDSGAGRLLISQQYVGDYVGMWAVAVLATAVSALGFGLVAVVGRFAAPWTSHRPGASGGER